jgi:hypothetical protein
MSVSRLRLENTSLYNYLKYELVAKHFTEVQTTSLVYNSSLGAYIPSSVLDIEPSPTSAGRGWVFFDDYTTSDGTVVVDTSKEQTTKVTVTGATHYTVDYTNGRIYDPNTVPTSVTYSWYYLSVLDAWPGINPPPLPVVSIDVDTTNKSGFQLGGGKKNTRIANLYIFATNKAERDDITDILQDSLFNRQITVKDYSKGDYLNYNGMFNTGFNPDILEGSIQILSAEARNINAWVDWSELNRYRSTIKLTFETYIDSV